MILWTTPVPDGPRVEGWHDALLESAERDKAGRFRSESARAQFITGRALARFALSQAARESGAIVDPARWHIAADPRGRPIVGEPVPPAPLFFSISHAEGLIACLVGPLEQAAVDVECAAPGVDRSSLLATAPDILTERERVDVAAHPDPVRRFLAYWTLKEAFTKAQGRGLAIDFRTLDFTLADPPRLLTPGFQDWSFQRIDLSPHHLVALAARTPALSVTHRTATIPITCAAGGRS